MGVPGLFRYVCQRHPNAIKDIRVGDYHTKVDNLYIDSNALIHKAAQIIFAYGSYKTLIPVCDPNLPVKEKEKELFKLFWGYLCDIVETVTPTKVLYIAIDGCAPCGKMSQQRQRRFVAARTREKGSWNSSKITPGTLFMWELTKFINYSIRHMMISSPIWRRLTVFFSPHNVHSEGEHKVLDYIRSLPNAKDLSHCIWGPDGDLIMLSLIVKCPKFLWYREDNITPAKACIIDIGTFSKRIVSQWGKCILYSPRNLRIKIIGTQIIIINNQIINDFVLIGFFVGNDFLPKIAMFHLLEQGFDVMLEEYGDMRLTTGDNHIDMKSFSLFIDRVAHRERELLEGQASVSVRDKRFINRTLLSCVKTSISARSKAPRKVLDYEAYREKYYKIKLKISSDEEIEKLCKDYVRGLNWVFEYYCNGCPSFQWYYPYHYAPLFADLTSYMKRKFVEKIDPPNLEFVSTKPSEPFQQLLSVLPSQSVVELLPSIYTKLMKCFPEYYPLEFDVDYEGVNKEYQGIALLPFVDPDHLRKKYEKFHTIKSVRIYKRNQPGKIRKFTMNHNSPTYNYVSDYGSLRNCRVVVSNN